MGPQETLPFIEPISNTFLKEGLLGTIILAQAGIIGYLFRKLMAEKDVRITDIKEMTETHNAENRETIKAISSNTTILESVKIALGKR